MLSSPGCSAAIGVRTESCGIDESGSVAHAGLLSGPSLPKPSTAATTYPFDVPGTRPVSTNVALKRPLAASVKAEPAASTR